MRQLKGLLPLTAGSPLRVVGYAMSMEAGTTLGQTDSAGDCARCGWSEARGARTGSPGLGSIEDYDAMFEEVSLRCHWCEEAACYACRVWSEDDKGKVLTACIRCLAKRKLPVSFDERPDRRYSDADGEDSSPSLWSRVRSLFGGGQGPA